MCMYMYMYTSVCLYSYFFPHILYHSATCLFKLSRSCKSFRVKTQRSVGLAKKLGISVRWYGKIQVNFLANPVLYSVTAMVCLIL